MVLGFIGLGIMGKPMCRNLMKAGHELVVYDVNSANMEAIVKDGARAAASSEEVAKQCQIIITMLPNSPHVKSAVLGEKGVLSGARENSVLIDMSSIAPAASREIKTACDKKHIAMLDAPVSGGEPKAVDGTLSIMVGGEEAVFEKMKPILLSMGSSAIYCGEIGAGNMAKLVNQVIVAGNIAVCAEAFMLAKKSGISLELVFQAIRGGLAGSTVMEAKVPMMLAHNFEPGFRIDLHIKDLNNAIETGHDAGSPMILTSIVMEMLEQLHADQCGQCDHSALIKYYSKLTGIEL